MQVSHASLVVPNKVGRVDTIRVGKTISLLDTSSLGAEHLSHGRASGGGGGVVAVVVGKAGNQIDINGSAIVFGFLLAGDGCVNSCAITNLAALSSVAGNSSHTGRKHNIIARSCTIGWTVTVSRLGADAVSGAISAILGTFVVGDAQIWERFSCIDRFSTIAFLTAHSIVAAKAGSDTFNFHKDVAFIVAVLVFTTMPMIFTVSITSAVHAYPCAVVGCLTTEQSVRSGTLHLTRALHASQASEASGNWISRVFCQLAIIDGGASSHALANSVRSAVFGTGTVRVSGTCRRRGFLNGSTIASHATHSILANLGSDTGDHCKSRIESQVAILEGGTSSDGRTKAVRCAELPKTICPHSTVGVGVAGVSWG